MEIRQTHVEPVEEEEEERVEWERDKWGRERENESRGKQRNGLNIIYCNSSSSRGALCLKGLINSFRGINKVSLIFQGAPGPSITILSPPQDPSTLSSHHSDNNSLPLVSVPPAVALKMFLPAPSMDKRLHFPLKVSDTVAPYNSPMIKHCTLLYGDLNGVSRLSTVGLILPAAEEPGLYLGTAAEVQLWLWGSLEFSSTPDEAQSSWPPSAASSLCARPLKIRDNAHCSKLATDNRVTRLEMRKHFTCLSFLLFSLPTSFD